MSKKGALFKMRLLQPFELPVLGFFVFFFNTSSFIVHSPQLYVITE